jgi:hypothetical protein
MKCPASFLQWARSCFCQSGFVSAALRNPNLSRRLMDRLANSGCLTRAGPVQYVGAAAFASLAAQEVTVGAMHYPPVVHWQGAGTYRRQGGLRRGFRPCGLESWPLELLLRGASNGTRDKRSSV